MLPLSKLQYGPSNIDNYQPAVKLAGIAQNIDGTASALRLRLLPREHSTLSTAEAQCSYISTTRNWQIAIDNQQSTYTPCNYFDSYTYTAEDGTPRGLVCNYYQYVQHPQDATGQNPPAYTTDPNPKVVDSYGWAVISESDGLLP